MKQLAFSTLFTRPLPVALLTIAGVMMPLAWTGGNGVAPAQAQTTQVAQSTLLMGTEADYIPFEFRYAAEPASGIVGFDIAVANAIADRLGFAITVQERPLRRIATGVAGGGVRFCHGRHYADPRAIAGGGFF
jgi:ABC-type amino acid transport substrate-binding protein